jgi:hypothetical protein
VTCSSLVRPGLRRAGGPRGNRDRTGPPEGCRSWPLPREYPANYATGRRGWRSRPALTGRSNHGVPGAREIRVALPHEGFAVVCRAVGRLVRGRAVRDDPGQEPMHRPPRTRNRTVRRPGRAADHGDLQLRARGVELPRVLHPVCPRPAAPHLRERVPGFGCDTCAYAPPDRAKQQRGDGVGRRGRGRCAVACPRDRHRRPRSAPTAPLSPGGDRRRTSCGPAWARPLSEANHGKWGISRRTVVDSARPTDSAQVAGPSPPPDLDTRTLARPRLPRTDPPAPKAFARGPGGRAGGAEILRAPVRDDLTQPGADVDRSGAGPAPVGRRDAFRPVKSGLEAEAESRRIGKRGIYWTTMNRDEKVQLSRECSAGSPPHGEARCRGKRDLPAGTPACGG